MVKIYIKPGKEWLKPLLEDALLEYELVEEIDSDHMKREVLGAVEKQKKQRLNGIKANGVL